MSRPMGHGSGGTAQSAALELGKRSLIASVLDVPAAHDGLKRVAAASPPFSVPTAFAESRLTAPRQRGVHGSSGSSELVPSRDPGTGAQQRRSMSAGQDVPVLEDPAVSLLTRHIA